MGVNGRCDRLLMMEDKRAYVRLFWVIPMSSTKRHVRDDPLLREVDDDRHHCASFCNHIVGKLGQFYSYGDDDALTLNPRNLATVP